MPVPAPRDPGAARDILTGWLGDPARLPGARITNLETPEFSGFSSEILMVDVEHGGVTQGLAVRVAPRHYQVFPETRFAEQYRLMRVLDSCTDIPVPPVLWYEPDPGYLGAPFIYEHYMHWAYPGPKPTATRALAWLKEHKPDEQNEPVLLWGDARIGNIIFAPGGVPLAVLDWETATFGQPEEDLAWYLFLDRHHSEGVYAPRLDGFPSPGETIARYSGLLGRPMLHMDYYEVLSGFKFTVIMSRVARAMIEWDWLIQEDHAGRRVLEEAVRVRQDGTSEYLGRPSCSPAYADGTGEAVSARISFSPPDGKPFDMHATPLLPAHLMVGTGYGLEPDWKHGMYQGPGPVVQGVSYDLSRREDAARMWGMVDAAARFEYDGNTGYGLYEYWALGDHPSFR